MGYSVEFKDFKSSIALMEAGERIKADEQALNEILEGSGYTDCAIDEVDTVSLYYSEVKKAMSLIVEFSYYNDHKQEEATGTVWISYKDSYLVAEF